MFEQYPATVATANTKITSVSHRERKKINEMSFVYLFRLF